MAHRYTKIVMQSPDGHFRNWCGEYYGLTSDIGDACSYGDLVYLKDYCMPEGFELVEYELTARPTGRRTAELYPNGKCE